MKVTYNRIKYGVIHVTLPVYAMTDNVKSLLVGWCCLLLTFVSFGQDPVFSRQTIHPQYENPAFVGASRNTDFYAVYRNQYPSLTTNYLTYNLGLSTFVDDLSSGFGVGVMHDDSADGLYRTTSIEAQYSYRLQLQDGAYLSSGLSLGYGLTEVDFDRLTFLDQIDPVTGPRFSGGLPVPTGEQRPTDSKVGYLDMGAGVVFYTNKFFVGGGLHHVNNPANDFLVNEFQESTGVDGLPMRWSISAGATIPILETSRELIFAFYPSLFYTRQRDFGQLQVGGFFKYKQLDFGLTTRLSGDTPDAVVGSFGASFGAAKIYYAYDYTISSLGSSGGAHELGFGYRIGPEYKPEVDCFDLFR